MMKVTVMMMMKRKQLTRMMILKKSDCCVEPAPIDFVLHQKWLIVEYA
jgi:hypothetical protein